MPGKLVQTVVVRFHLFLLGTSSWRKSSTQSVFIKILHIDRRCNVSYFRCQWYRHVLQHYERYEDLCLNVKEGKIIILTGIPSDFVPALNKIFKSVFNKKVEICSFSISLNIIQNLQTILLSYKTQQN